MRAQPLQHQQGDVVQLKSGGPKMTIDSLFEDGMARCQWFAGSKLEIGVFPIISLVAADPND